MTAALSLASQTSSSPHMPCIDEKLWPSANGTDDFMQALEVYDQRHRGADKFGAPIEPDEAPPKTSLEKLVEQAKRE